MNITCQAYTPEDALFLQDLFFDVRSPEFLLGGLSGPILTQLLEMQYRAQQASYSANYPSASNELIYVDGERAGRILVDTSASAVELIDVALLQGFRGRGIGRTVLDQLCVTADKAGKTVKLSVRPGNPAQRLYQSLGFAVTGMEPTQIWMQRPLGNATPVAGSAPVDAASSTQTPDAQVPNTQAPVAQDYSSAYFRSLLGSELQARLIRDDPATVPPPVPLLVASVTPLPHPDGAVDLGDSFRLELTGSVDAVFQAECIEVTPANGRPMAIFVSPLGPDSGRMLYDVVFNRMTRLA